MNTFSCLSGRCGLSPEVPAPKTVYKQRKVIRELDLLDLTPVFVAGSSLSVFNINVVVCFYLLSPGHECSLNILNFL